MHISLQSSDTMYAVRKMWQNYTELVKTRTREASLGSGIALFAWRPSWTIKHSINKESQFLGWKASPKSWPKFNHTPPYKGIIGSPCKYQFYLLMQKKMTTYSLSYINIRFLAFWVPSSILILSIPAVLMAVPLPLPPKVPVGPIKPRIVRCRTPLFPKCFNLPFLCPLPCLTNCFVDCVTCRPVCSKLTIHPQYSPKNAIYYINNVTISLKIQNAITF